MEVVQTSWGVSASPGILISKWKSQNFKQPLEGNRGGEHQKQLHLPQYVCTCVNTDNISVLSERNYMFLKSALVTTSVGL